MDAYAQRRNIFEKEDWQWTLGGADLIERSPSGKERRLALKKVSCVTLTFVPTRYKNKRHILAITGNDGFCFQIENYTFRSLANFEDQSVVYTPFVKKIITVIAEQSPQVMVSLGVTPLRYALNLIIIIAALTFLVFVILCLPMPVGLWPVTVLVKLGLMAWAIPTVFRWIIRSRPRQIPIRAIPDTAYPQ